MAQDSGVGDVIKWGLILGGGYLLWVYYTNSQAAAAAAATAAAGTTSTTGSTDSTGTTSSSTTSGTTSSSSGSTTPTPGLVIPSNLVVAKTLNNSLTGTVQLNGESVPLSIITGNSPATSGVIYNSGGTDITSQFTSAQQAQLVQAFLLAPQSPSGTSGLGHVFVLPRLYTAGTGRRIPGRIGAA
jgi:hypothetical protein